METADGWMERANYDLDTARAMFDSGRYLYVAFCCQQAVEKMLKAVIVKRSGDFPPYIHALPRLAEVAALDLTEEQAQFLRELSNYYIQTRYPGTIPEAAARIGESRARQVLDQTEGIAQWLRSMM